MTSVTARPVRSTGGTRRIPCRWVSVELPSDPRSVGVARHLVVETLCHWELESLGANGALLVTELATNALLHTGGGLRVDVDLRKDVVRIGVLDTSELAPHRRRHGVAAATGRGLGLVELLSSDWGVEGADGSPWRKTVWFELPTDPRLLAQPADGALLEAG